MRSLPATLLILAAACAPAERRGTAEPARVDVRPALLRLAAGGSAQLTAEALDEQGRPIGGAELRFTSTDPAILQVSPLGLVSAPGPVGAATIHVASGARSAAVPVTVVPGAPAALKKLGGDGQSGQVANALRDRVEVQVLDSRGNPVPGAEVAFAASEGGSLAPPVAHADATGRAAAAWVLGERAGRQQATARSGESSVVFETAASAGPAVRVVAVGTLEANPRAGATLDLEVLTSDRAGNPAAGSKLAWRVRSGGGALEGASDAADASGLGRARWTLGPKTGRNTLLVSLAAAPETGLEWVADSRAGPAARLERVAGDRQRCRAGRAVRVAPSVQVVDGGGNPVAGARVRFRAEAGGTVEPQEAISDGHGVAAVARWVPGEVGTRALEAAVEGTEGARFTATVSK